MIAPAGPVPFQSLANGRTALEREGFRVVLGDHVLDHRGYLAGTAADRAADLMKAFLDPTVAGIVCARGGYGAMQVLPLLDYAAIRANPKVFVGYSDITALHSALARHTGLVTFHGQMASFGEPPSDYTWGALMRAITCAEPLGTLVNPPAHLLAGASTGGQTDASAGGPEGRPAQERGPATVALVAGQATGRLTGGNLSLMSATLGTPYEVDTDGALLVIEDVGEAPYRMDRMIMHLRLAGKFDGVRGIIFGESVGCERDERYGQDEDPPRSLDLLQVLRDLLVPLGVPLFYGFACGHGRHRVTLPFGVEATMDADAGTVTVLESALVEGHVAAGEKPAPARPPASTGEETP